MHCISHESLGPRCFNQRERETEKEKEKETEKEKRD